ncbi:MAG: ATP-binding cassette domain-containing protein [bacterium]|nr:ATP-binding cassette domain-containing protein [bacterium]
MEENKKEILLELKNVSLETEDQSHLNDIFLSVSKGENVVLFGPENSGLDSLFPLILGFEEDFKGDILYKGQSIKEFDYFEIHNYRKDIGYNHADFGLMSNMSVEENIALPMTYHSDLSKEEIRKVVSELINELNLDHCKKLRPIDLLRSEILKTAYARAVALDPDMVLMEHTFEGQSPLNIESLMESLRKRAFEENKTVIFITYEPDKFLDMADVYIMLFNGRVVFTGTKRDYVDSTNEYLNQYKGMSNKGPMVIL